MKCDDCGVEDAVVHLTQIRDGRKSERHVCLRCAAIETGGGGGGDIEDVLRAWVEKQSQTGRREAGE
jgi:protein-arginine kinase activator protein McsA